MPDEPKIKPAEGIPLEGIGIIGPVQKLQEFLDKEGLAISASPTFVPTNHGSFEVGIRVSVEKKE